MTEPIEADTAAAIDFMRLWSPEDDWCIAAIVPDGKTETRTFKPSKADEAADWIAERQGVKNLYFHVNRTRQAFDKKGDETKPGKANVLRLTGLHVDLDPRAGEDIEQERDRALALLQAFNPKPTAIIDSGGGLQGFWKLEPSDRLNIDGDAAKAQDLERYNIQLEAVLQADHCHNCDRLMRLPGTINVPNAKKAKKGRKRALARLIEWNGIAYPLEAFTPAAAKASTAARPATGKARAAVGMGNGTGMGVDELREWADANGKRLNDATLARIATGTDPLAPDKYPSRSEALFAVCCELVRAGVDDEVIYRVITGPNRIAASVEDKPNPSKYALEQIGNARAAVAEAAEARGNVGEDAGSLLDELNSHHAVITSGKVRVLSWRCTHPELEREAPDLQSFEDFRNRYRNKRVTVGFNANGQPIEKPVGNWWLDHPQRREVRGICFVPGKDPEINGFQNLWRGWGVEPRPGGDWSLMRDHILYLCGGSDFGLKWIADALQNPDRPSGVAWVLRGNRGTGKGILGRALVHIFGQHGLQITSAKHLTGDFNLHLRDCCLLFADEVVTQGDKRAEAVLKGLVTEETLTIEGKGQDIQTAPNYLHILMASNEGWVVPAGVDERRFAVFDVPDEHKQDRDYFVPIAAQLFREGKNGVMVPGDGLAAMLYDLLTLELGDWEPRWNIPQTAALARQKAESLSGVEAYIFDLLLSGEVPPGAERLRSSGVLFVPSEGLIESARKWVQGRPGANHITYNNVRDLLASKLRAAKHRKGGGGANGYLWCLAELRRAWDECASLFPWRNWPPEPDDYYEAPSPSPF